MKTSPPETSLMLGKIYFFGLQTRVSFTGVPAGDYPGFLSAE